MNWNTPIQTNSYIQNVMLHRENNNQYLIVSHNLGITVYRFWNGYHNDSLIFVQFIQNPIDQALYLQEPRMMNMVNDCGEWILLVINAFTDASENNMIAILRFGNTIENPPSYSRIVIHTGGTGIFPNSMATAKDCQGWHSLVVSPIAGLIRIDYGDRIDTTFTKTVIGTFANQLTGVTGVQLLNDLGDWYLFAQRSDRLIRLRFGKKLTNLPQFFNLGALGVPGFRISLGSYYANSRRIFYSMNSTGNLDLYRFIFPDSCSADIRQYNGLTPPPVTYQKGGEYKVNFAAVSNSCYNIFYADSVTVLPSPDVNFGAYNLCNNSPVSFVDSSVSVGDTVVQWLWDFGDGGATTVFQNPIKIYPDTGTYTVTLTATGLNGCSISGSKTLTINPSPKANFGFVVGCANEPVQFTDSSTIISGNIVFRKWEFGDGTISVDQNPSHRYFVGGPMTVKLIVVSDLGCLDSITKVVNVPLVNFQTSSTCFGDTTRFTPLVDYFGIPVSSYQWNFGDPGSGSSNVSTLPNPEHIYPALGQYQ
ncbi:MAG: PKD domain-containing protein, partial [Bacteroidia bacterium]|nr:PKD domain-containing protein [Bacteroidia bacterium]